MQINRLASIHGPQAIQAPHRVQNAQPARPSQQVAGADQLDISPKAELLSRIREIPGIRADRVAEIRAQIDAGTYETAEKLSTALDRLFDEIG